jgi:hypothetical protein
MGFKNYFLLFHFSLFLLFVTFLFFILLHFNSSSIHRQRSENITFTWNWKDETLLLIDDIFPKYKPVREEDIISE